MNGNEYMINISSTICELRKNLGMTQEALADKLGVTYQAVSKWENEQSCPDIQLIPQIADIFGVTINWLFGRKSKVVYEKSPGQNLVHVTWDVNSDAIISVILLMSVDIFVAITLMEASMQVETFLAKI